MDIEGLEVKITGSRDKSITYWKDGVMIGRKCTVCKEDKEIERFSFHNKRKGTYKPSCKECDSKKRKEYYGKNKESENKKKKEYYEKNKEYIKEKQKQYGKQYRENNKEQIKERKKRWRESNPEYMKRWRENNPEYGKEWRRNNKEQIKEYNKKLKEAQYYKEYFENNTERYHECGKKSREKRKQNNLQYISSIVEQINPVFKQLNLPIYGYVYIVAFCQYHLDKMEAYYIDKYDSYNNGYNNNAGHHDTNDGLEEFMEILQQYNLEFVDGQIVKKAN